MIDKPRNKQPLHRRGCNHSLITYDAQKIIQLAETQLLCTKQAQFKEHFTHP